MVGAQASFVFSGSYLRKPRPILFVANSKEEAAYFYHNLASLLPRKPIWFFPDSSRTPGLYREVNSTQVLQRTETINKITGVEASAHIIVTYPEALAEKQKYKGQHAQEPRNPCFAEYMKVLIVSVIDTQFAAPGIIFCVRNIEGI